jgi:hypothetical protein
MGIGSLPSLFFGIKMHDSRVGKQYVSPVLFNFACASATEGHESGDVH